MNLLNETHQPELSSWVASANDGRTDFPIQNLPFAIFKRQGSNEKFRAGVAIGEHIVDLKAAHKAGVFSMSLTPMLKTLYKSKLNQFMGLGKEAWSELRLELSRALRSDSSLQTQLEN
jgi:fumarylacetoacetase